MESKYNNNNKKQLTVQRKQRMNKKGQMKPVNYKKNRIEGGTANYGKQMIQTMESGYGKTLSMYPSTQNFAKVYGDPFLKESARIPVFPIRASKMLRVMTGVSGVLNGTGVGFVTVKPAFCIINDKPSIFYSNAAASPPFLTTDNGTYAIGSGFAASPYTLSDFDYGVNGKTFRIVAQAIRVRYVGTTLNAAGSCYCAQLSPEKDLNGYTVDDIKRQMGWKEYVFSDRSWHSICRHITTTDDQDYQYWNGNQGNFYYYNGSGTPTKDNFPFYGMILTGTAGQPFEIEVCTHIELVAPSLDQLSVSTHDAQGVGTVIASYAKARNRDNTSTDHSVGTNKWSSILKAGIETATTIGKAVLPFLL